MKASPAVSLYITESHVHVTRNWLILPWVLEVLVITALLMANLQAPKQKASIWRSSLLPLLFHSLEEPMGDLGESSGKVSSMQHAAKHRLVKTSFARQDIPAVLATQSKSKPADSA